MNGTLTTMDKVLDQVVHLAHDIHDEVVPVKDIGFESLKSVMIRDRCHPIRDTAQRGLATRLKIPLEYLKKCPEDVQAYNLNHWIEQERNSELFLRFDGPELRAVFTTRYKPFDNLDVLLKLDGLGFGMNTEVQCHLDRNFMLLSIPDKTQEFVLRGNDVMRPGVSISNSEVGLASLSVSAYILRLLCTNGLVGKTEISTSYRHVSEKIMDEFPRVMGEVRQQLIWHRQQLVMSLESHVKEPKKTLQALNRQFLLQKGEVEAVDWAWIYEYGESMYHIVNTYTKAAQHRGLAADSAFRLQRVAGTILGMMN